MHCRYPGWYVYSALFANQYKWILCSIFWTRVEGILGPYFGNEFWKMCGRDRVGSSHGAKFPVYCQNVGILRSMLPVCGWQWKSEKEKNDEPIDGRKLSAVVFHNSVVLKGWVEVKQIKNGFCFAGLLFDDFEPFR